MPPKSVLSKRVKGAGIPAGSPILYRFTCNKCKLQ